MTTSKTTVMRVRVEDAQSIRLLAAMRGQYPSTVLHEAVTAYFELRRDEFARLHAETNALIADGDVDGLAQAMIRDADGRADRLAARARRRTTDR